MEDNLMPVGRSQSLIAEIYNAYYTPILKYIKAHTNNHYLSEDLAQNVFVRVLDYKSTLLKETIKSFIYSIAHNIVVDFLRCKMTYNEFCINVFDTIQIPSTEKTDSKVMYGELLSIEKQKMSEFPIQRKKVYYMSRYNDFTIADISRDLGISYRTVECHLYTGRKIMREYLLKCI